MFKCICIYTYVYHYTLKPALKSIKLKHFPIGCFVNRLLSLLTKQPVGECFSFIDFESIDYRLLSL